MMEEIFNQIQPIFIKYWLLGHTGSKINVSGDNKNHQNVVPTLKNNTHQGRRQFTYTIILGENVVNAIMAIIIAYIYIHFSDLKLL